MIVDGCRNECFNQSGTTAFHIRRAETIEQSIVFTQFELCKVIGRNRIDMSQQQCFEISPTAVSRDTIMLLRVPSTVCSSIQQSVPESS